VPGIQNAGTLVALGVVACLVATFLVLPALESLARRMQKHAAREARP
jgi:predicted RND superfamily exporter protein